MTDDLSAFIASGIEFIVGGLLMLGSIAFVLLAVEWNVPAFLEDVAWSSDNSQVLLAVVLLAGAYVTGVIGEGTSRMLCEWDLDRATVRTEAFLKGPVAPVSSQALKQRWAAWRLNVLDPDGFTRSHLDAAVKEREKQRTMSRQNPEVHSDIDSQLKRLRLERTAVLCALLVTFGFAFAGEQLDMLVSAAVTAFLAVLVHKRFRRYCDTIARAYACRAAV